MRPNPANGLLRDKTAPGTPCSIAVVGLCLATIPLLVERGVISREFAPELVLRELRFFHNSTHSPEPDATRDYQIAAVFHFATHAYVGESVTNP
jgi:hypothetical protein